MHCQVVTSQGRRLPACQQVQLTCQAQALLSASSSTYTMQMQYTKPFLGPSNSVQAFCEASLRLFAHWKAGLGPPHTGSPARLSTSSKKMMEGAAARASLKVARRRDSPSPTYMLNS